MNHPEHICRFNDAPQTCECYDAGYKQARAEERERVRGVIDMGVKKEAKRICFSERTAQIFWDGWGAGEEEKFIQRVLKENSFIAEILASLDTNPK